jgi:hypothetical protein
MRLVGTFNPRFEGAVAMSRLLLALERVTKEASQRGADDRLFAELADRAQPVYDALNAAYLRIVDAVAELKSATTEGATAFSQAATRHRQLAGTVFGLVGADAQALNGFGLRLEQRPLRVARKKKSGQSPASQPASDAGAPEVGTDALAKGGAL